MYSKKKFHVYIDKETEKYYLSSFIRINDNL